MESKIVFFTFVASCFTSLHGMESQTQAITGTWVATDCAHQIFFHAQPLTKDTNVTALTTTYADDNVNTGFTLNPLIMLGALAMNTLLVCAHSSKEKFHATLKNIYKEDLNDIINIPDRGPLYLLTATDEKNLLGWIIIEQQNASINIHTLFIRASVQKTNLNYFLIATIFKLFPVGVTTIAILDSATEYAEANPYKKAGFRLIYDATAQDELQAFAATLTPCR